MIVETGSFLLTIRQMRRNCSEHLGQVETAKAMPYFTEDWQAQIESVIGNGRANVEAQVSPVGSGPPIS